LRNFISILIAFVFAVSCNTSENNLVDQYNLLDIINDVSVYSDTTINTHNFSCSVYGKNKYARINKKQASDFVERFVIDNKELDIKNNKNDGTLYWQNNEKSYVLYLQDDSTIFVNIY